MLSKRLVFASLAALCWLVPGIASAEVEIGFYSKELGVTFPHAFVVLDGTLDATGERIDEAYGFTAKTISPAILMGSVAGKVIAEEEPYIEQSDRQFSLKLTDAEYRAARDVVERWRNRSQPSYNLNRRNCIHFVAEIAEAIGLKVDYPQALMKKPRSFLQAVKRANEVQLAARAAHAAAP
jgi:hypothetical protein